MQTMTIGEFKAHFSEVLEKIKKGKEIVISQGKKKEKVAILLPYKKYHSQKGDRKLGPLEGKAKYQLTSDFTLTDEELLSS